MDGIKISIIQIIQDWRKPVCKPDALFKKFLLIGTNLDQEQRSHEPQRSVQVLDVLDTVYADDVRLLQRPN